MRSTATRVRRKHKHPSSDDVLDSTAFRVLVVILLQLLLRWLCVRVIFKGIVFLVYGCIDVGVNVCSVVWASIFSALRR